MKIRKIIAAIAASAAAAYLMAVSAFAAQDVSGLADGTAYLNINNDQWSDFDAKWTNVKVTGEGTYTVSMRSDEDLNLALFSALEIVKGEVLFGRTYTVTVDSIKINGEEKKIADGYTCSANMDAVTTRVNIYNEWNSPENKAADDGNIDCRSADGDFMSKSSKLISDGNLIGVRSIEVTFTVAGITSGGQKPAEPVKPTEQPTESEKPTDPAKPAEPSEPEKPSKTENTEGNSVPGGNDASSGAPVSADEEPVDPDTASADAGEASDSYMGPVLVEIPLPDNFTIPPTTGNIPAAAMVSAIAVAGTAAIVFRKRK